MSAEAVLQECLVGHNGRVWEAAQISDVISEHRKDKQFTRQWGRAFLAENTVLGEGGHLSVAGQGAGEWTHITWQRVFYIRL